MISGMPPDSYAQPRPTPTGWRGNHFAPTPCQRIRNLTLRVEVFCLFPKHAFKKKKNAPQPPVVQEGTDADSD